MTKREGKTRISEQSMNAKRKSGTKDAKCSLDPNKFETIELLSYLRRKAGIEDFSQSAILEEGLDLILERDRSWMKQELKKLTDTAKLL